MIVSATQKPPPHPFYGDAYHRGLSPWHKDAFPDELKDYAPDQSEKRVSGWFLHDAYGNEIDFIPDGTELPI